MILIVFCHDMRVTENSLPKASVEPPKSGEAQSGAQAASFLRNGLPFLKSEIC